MTATVKAFHEVVPKLSLGVDFNLATHPDVDGGRPFVMFVRCPHCGRTFDPKGATAVFGVTDPSFVGELLYAIDAECGRALLRGADGTSVTLAVMGALASINTERNPSSLPPDVLIVDNQAAVVTGPGVPQ